MRGQAGFWDVDERYALLSEAGDPLVRLNKVVPWEVFRKPLAKALKRSDGTKGGKPPFDSVMMFKILVLQALYDLSDDQSEFLINDRLSFIRFLVLGHCDRIPDVNTIWLFREHLVEACATNNLFVWFDKHLSKSGYLAKGGQIVDATLIAAPKQRNRDGEKAAIKESKTADEIWTDEPAKAAEKHVDARWTVKFSKAKPDADGMVRQRDIAIPAFGYKNHASIDRHGGFIRAQAKMLRVQRQNPNRLVNRGVHLLSSRIIVKPVTTLHRPASALLLDLMSGRANLAGWTALLLF